MTKYSLDVLLFLSGTSLLFHVQFFLTCIQVSQKAGQVIWYTHLFQNFPQFIVIHTVKGFGIVKKAETDVFLELSCFFNDPADVGNLISGSSAFSKTSLNIWKFTVHILLKPGLDNFEHYFTSVWEECNCVVVWALFGITFLWDWNENWAFPVLWPLLHFPNLLTLFIINMILVLTIWWCLCVEQFLVVSEEGVCYDQCVLLAKLLAFALLHFVLQDQTCLLLQVFSWLPTFVFQSPMMKRTSFLDVSSRRSCRNF